MLVHPGSIGIVEAGLLDQPVHASSVVGASTARTMDGVTLALVRRGSPERPLVLDFDREGDLDAVRRALGLGHFGFGEVGWPTRVRSTVLQGSALLAIAWLAMALCSAFNLELPAFALALVVLPATVVALLVACVQNPHGPRVALTPAGVRFTDLPVWIPAHPLRGRARRERRPAPGFASRRTPVRCTSRWASRSRKSGRISSRRFSGGVSRPRRGTPAAHAARAARAPGAKGESERAWLQRIDAAAASIASAEAYRGSDLDPRDLWAALESPDAPARVRAAAARVLARVAPDEAKTRVAQVLASDRDPRACACIRVALEEDVETAARELEALRHR